ncbi:MAG: alpha-xylosidase [Streptosporangiales bacterium]|nr:alpha-xylosidase [Streptosporangiales bacterium]
MPVKVSARTPVEVAVRRKGRRDPSTYAMLLALVVLAVVMLIPFVIVVLNAIKSPAEYASRGPLALPEGLYLQGIVDFWNRVDFGQKLLNSVVISGSVAVVAVFLSILNAYAIGIGRVKGRVSLLVVFLLAAMLPQEALVYPLYYLWKQVGLYDTRLGVIVIFTVFQSAFGTYLLSSVLGTFPREILEAARIDGANRWQVLWRVVVPISRPTLTVLLIFFFIWTWNEFFIPLVMLISNENQTVPVALGVLQGQRLMDATTSSASALLGIVPAVVFFLFFQRTLTRGVTVCGGDQVKFGDGYRMRPGFEADHPVEVLDLAVAPGSLTVYAPTRRILHRADLHDSGPVVTLGLSAPMPDVVGVTITHFAGEVPRGPRFELDTDSSAEESTEVWYDDETAVLTSGALSVRVSRGEGWRVDFTAEGRTLTSSGARGMAFVTADDGRHYVRDRLNLGVGDAVYGLGERFGPLVKNGQVVDIWNADAGTGSEQAYKNVPFYLTNAGYGVFVNHPGHVSFEVASEAMSSVQFSVEGQSLEYFVVYGPTPAEILRKYTALTGRPALPPAWSFGLWLSTSFTTSYDEATVTGFIDGMAERDLPLSVFHFDCFWMREFHWCDFEWDPRVFPDPRGMLERLKSRGLRICVWINPYIAQRSQLFAEGTAGGYLLERPNGDVWQWDRWQPGMALVDFTNPEAREWYAAKLDALLDMGVDCFKTDFGERIPTDVAYFDGSDPEPMHNYYSYLYTRTVFEVLRKRRGDREAVVFARSATAGSQRFPVHWGGDSAAAYESMAESLRGGLSLGMSGFGYWSHDIGGFWGAPGPGLFKRWVAFGMLSSHSRLHGDSSYRVPWLFDEESVDVLRLFTKLKARLMPYLFQVARQAHTDGVPMMRAMALAFPHDPACVYLDRQYMLGDDLLVAPVFSDEGTVSYYVPPGSWTHFLTGEPVNGPRWVEERHDFLSIPLLVRPGAVVPVGGVDDRPDYDYADGVTLQAYELADGARATTTIPTVTGDVATTFVTSRQAGVVRVEVDHGRSAGVPRAWQVLLVGVRSVASVDGGTATEHAHGTLVRADGEAVTVTLGESPPRSMLRGSESDKTTPAT